jgi:hypothetical protein
MEIVHSCTNCGYKGVLIEIYESYLICENCLDESIQDLNDVPYAPI